MRSKRFFSFITILCIALFFTACIPTLTQRSLNKSIPDRFNSSGDTTTTASVKWKEFFNDPNLLSLIDTALLRNQDLNIVLHDILIARNEVKAKKGEYLPFLNAMAGAGAEKTALYTRFGANDATTDIKPGTKTPELLPNYMLGVDVSWQLDVWKQLRNAKKSAMYNYLATVEGKNFMVSLLVAEIANEYYELMALDNQLEILKSNISILENALTIVKLEKEAGEVTELAVLKFEAEVYKNQSLLYFIQQSIIEAENRINFLVGRYPQPVPRNSKTFIESSPKLLSAGIPSQLLENRPDIRQAEQSVLAANLDLQVAKANFYPVFTITAGVGYEAFSPKYLINTPNSIVYNLAGGLVAPLVNRNAIKASYFSANSRQIQSVYQYERTVLNAYTEVINQLSNINNLSSSIDAKMKQVDVLTRSINISIFLFKTARANYMEVLMTQRDALESRMQMVEIKKAQMHAMVNMYQVLGGGWN